MYNIKLTSFLLLQHKLTQEAHQILSQTKVSLESKLLRTTAVDS